MYALICYILSSKVYRPQNFLILVIKQLKIFLRHSSASCFEHAYVWESRMCKVQVNGVSAIYGAYAQLPMYVCICIFSEVRSESQATALIQQSGKHRKTNNFQLHKEPKECRTDPSTHRKLPTDILAYNYQYTLSLTRLAKVCAQLSSLNK